MYTSVLTLCETVFASLLSQFASTLNGKNLLTMQANSFLPEKTPFQSGSGQNKIRKPIMCMDSP